MAYREIDIEIGYGDLYGEVDKVTGYTAAKASEDGSMYRRMATLEENREILQSFILDAEEFIAEVLYIYLRDSNYETSVRYTLTMPSNWLDNREDLRKAVFWFMVYYASMRWFRVVGGESAAANEEKYKTDASDKLDDIRKFINRRRRPGNPFPPAIVDEEGDVRS